MFNPPEGAFSLAQLHALKALQLVRVRGQSEDWWAVLLPEDRLRDLTDGEKKLAGTNTPPIKGTAGKKRDHNGGVTYECQRASPPTRAKKAAPPREGVRGGGQVHGLGERCTPLKVDCPYRFTVQVQSGGVMLVKIKASVLKEGHNHGCDGPTRFPDPWVSALIAEEYDRNDCVTSTYLRKLILETAQAIAVYEGNYESYEELLAAQTAHTAFPTREELITMQDINSVLRKLRNQSDSLAASDLSDGIAAFAAQNEDSIFFYQPGEGGEDEKVCFGSCNTTSPSIATSDPPLTQPENGFAIGICTPWQLKMLREHGHQSVIIMDGTEGTVSIKYPLTIGSVVDKDFGTTIPVFFVLHKYKHKSVLTDVMYNLGVFASNSARHADWPLRRNPADAPPPPLPPSPHGPAWAAAAAAWQTGNSPARRLPVPQKDPVIPFCPAYLKIDCCAIETAAGESCPWSKGWQGDGLSPAEFAMWVSWCSWHLDRAWTRQSIKLVANVSVRTRLMNSLTDLRNKLVEVLLEVLQSVQPLTVCPQDASSAQFIIRGFVEEWRKVDGVNVFLDYWVDNYDGADNVRRWLRPVYLARFPEDRHKLIPTGTQGGEGMNSSIKMVDLPHLCGLFSSPSGSGILRVARQDASLDARTRKGAEHSGEDDRAALPAEAPGARERCRPRPPWLAGPSHRSRMARSPAGRCSCRGGGLARRIRRRRLLASGRRLAAALALARRAGREARPLRA